VRGVVGGAVFNPVNFAVEVEAGEHPGREQDFALVGVAHGLHGDRVVGAREAIHAAPLAHERNPPHKTVDVRGYEHPVAALGIFGRRQVEFVHGVVPLQHPALEVHLEV